jgi:hypothetical protein
LFFNNLEEVVKIYQLELMCVMRIGEDWWVVIDINHMYERVLAKASSLEYGIFKLILYDRFSQEKPAL